MFDRQTRRTQRIDDCIDSGYVGREGSFPGYWADSDRNIKVMEQDDSGPLLYFIDKQGVTWVKSRKKTAGF